MSIEDKLKQGIKEIVEILVKQDYEMLEKLDKIGVLTANEVKSAILAYGENLSLPPESAYDEMDIFKLDSPQKFAEEYTIDFEMWTNNLKSDIALTCEAGVDKQGNVVVNLYSVHVL